MHGAFGFDLGEGRRVFMRWATTKIFLLDSNFGNYAGFISAIRYKKLEQFEFYC
jgi:hypothetical protein